MSKEPGMFEKPKRYIKNTLLTTMAAVGLNSHELPAQTVQNPNKGRIIENVLSHREFRTFKSCELGSKSAEELKREVKPCLLGFSIDMMNSFEVSHKVEQIKLVKISVADLGFKNGVTYGEILRRAGELGLKVCPVEAGPELRLQYVNQPEYDRFYVAMKPIIRKDAYEEAPLIFQLACEKVDSKNHPSGLYLFSHTVGEDRATGSDWVFKPNESFVFVQGE